jgi:inositol oxygenase
MIHMNAAGFSKEELNPLQSIEQWEDDVLIRYPEPDVPAKSKEEFAITIILREIRFVNFIVSITHTRHTTLYTEKRNDFLQFNRKEIEKCGKHWNF